jgi:hypothetical protein
MKTGKMERERRCEEVSHGNRIKETGDWKRGNGEGVKV